LGHSEGWDKVMSDIELGEKRIRVEDVPHFIFGHSMGGMIALIYALKYQTRLAGVIASGLFLFFLFFLDFLFHCRKLLILTQFYQLRHPFQKKVVKAY